MDNYQIADNFVLLSKLLDIHGENSFKSKSYASAAFNIEKLPSQLNEIAREKIASLKGIGASSAQKIIELLDTGKLQSLEDLIQNTPPGVIEMLNIKGIGAKKIHTIWKEMEIESLGELLYACKENRLKLYKGFGEKTQQNVTDSIEFYFKNSGNHLYANVVSLVPILQEQLQQIFPDKKLILTGDFKRQMPVINALEFLINEEIKNIITGLDKIEGISLVNQTENFVLLSTSWGIDLKIYTSSTENLLQNYFLTSSDAEFAKELLQKFPANDFTSEEQYFDHYKLPYIASPIRETDEILELAINGQLPNNILATDIKGIIHCHSNWSDGSNTIEEMANAAISLGLEYLVISDHSKSAFYAQGLYEDKIIAQHQYIDELNIKLAPFKIFKSIESDILNDGNLDYSPSVLASFDAVIASVHSNLKMTEDKAMHRLITAIENPYTTILGHPTGRLLLSRKGYPVDHRKIIDACAANKVVIELNASPSRLDLDYQYINYALEKAVLISINPDAHSIEQLSYTKYGVYVAQKTLLTKEKNLSSFSKIELENYLAAHKKF